LSRGAGFGGIEEGIVPNSIAASRVVDDLVVGASFEEVADGEVEGEVICLEVSATPDHRPIGEYFTSVSVDEYS
jgi:hypothetical protein